MKTHDLLFRIKILLFKYRSWKYYKTLLENQYLSTNDIKKLQFEKLKRIVVHAYNNSDFYRKKYDLASFSPELLCSIDDIEKIPLLTKEELKSNPETILVKNVKKRHLTKSNTGGSTGQPLTVFHDRRVPIEAMGWRMFDWWGISPAINVAFLYRQVNFGLKKILNQIIWWPTKRYFLDARRINKADVLKMSSVIKRNKIELIQGYAGAVIDATEIMKNEGIKHNGVKAVWTTAAPITKAQKDFVSNYFKAPVYDQYGCGEVFWIAAECAQNTGLHVFDDIRIVEIVDNENQKIFDSSNYGKLLVTDLENYVYPIIRYENGDKARYSKISCPCGLSFTLLDPIKGRTSDTLRFKDGSFLSGEFLTTIFDNYPNAVRYYQIIQHSVNDMTLKYVLGDSNQHHNIILVQKELKRLVPHNVSIKLEEVKSIPADGGKTKFIIKEDKIN